MTSGWRNALAAIGVLAGLVALVGAAAAVDAALPEEGPLPPGERLDVGYGVTLRPPPGARQDLAASRPGTGDVVLKVRGLRVAVSAVQVRERPADYIAHARHKLNRDEGFRVGQPDQVRTASGVPGQRFDLAGERAGCGWIFTGQSAGVTVLASPVKGCAAAPAEVRAAVTSMTFEPADEW